MENLNISILKILKLSFQSSVPKFNQVILSEPYYTIFLFNIIFPSEIFDHCQIFKAPFTRRHIAVGYRRKRLS